MSEENFIEVKNLTKFYTLALLKSKKSVTGYYILKKLKSDLNKTASPTYIYDFLKLLKSEGYIIEVSNPKTMRKKGYKLTDTGNAFVERIFSRLNNLIEVAVQTKLKICVSCGVRLYEDFYKENINGKDYNFCCKHCAKAFKMSQ
ncbi:MAG: PadR family transcriptional regulator [Promethearchaeota archaeon]